MLGISGSLPAIDDIELQFETLEGAGWSARDVRITLGDMAGPQPRLELVAARVELPEGLAPLEAFTLTCNALVLQNEEVACEQASVTLQTPTLDAPTLRARFRYRLLTRELDWHIDAVRIAGGAVRIEGRHAGEDWQFGFDALGVDLGRLSTLGTGWAFWPAGFTAQGMLSGSGAWAGHTGATRQQVELDAKVQGLAYATADGASAAEAVNVALDIKGSKDAADWDLRVDLRAHDGTFCLADCWELTATPLQLRGRVAMTPTRLRVDALQIEQAGVAKGALDADYIGTSRDLSALSLRIDDATLSALYPTYLQPLLIGTSLESLQTAGRVNGRIDYADGRWRYDLATDRIDVTDTQGRFALAGLHGRLRWGDAQSVTSELAFEAGRLYRLPVGAARIVMAAAGDGMRLTAPLELPVLDGALRIDQFSLQGAGTPALAWSFEGLLKPVSMSDFSAAMDWPVMGGRLSGLIPEVRFADGTLDIGGVLLVRAFDGAITVRDLRIEDLFGVVPRLYTDVRIDNIDLDELTRTFAFGSIQGRFSGTVDNLILSRWRPVAFDAVLATPKDDRSRHRISQKAVDSLTSIGGGGVSGALSRSFLGVFETFGYDRLGISCRLRNGVCQMDGVAPAGEGYYIVKGGGLPRIDVIGYSREVDWEVLLQRLERVTGSTSAVVE